MTRVSVVVNNFNYARFIGNSIDSALAQTYADIEVIVVDDGSTDNSREIIDGYGDRVRRVYKQNGGQASAMQAGIETSRGEIICFLDSDDIMYPDLVSRAVAAWRPSLAKIQFQLDTIDFDGNNLNMPFPYYPADLTSEEIHRQSLKFGVYTWPVTLGNAYAKAYLQQIMPFPDFMRYSADTYLNKMAPLFGDVGVLHAILGGYRVHGANHWASSAVREKKYCIALTLDYKLRDIFSETATARGFQCDGRMQRLNRSNLETRLLSLRLAPEHHPIPDDNLRRALSDAFISARISPGLTLFGRILWMSWYTAITIVPKPMIRFFVARGRIQNYRDPVLGKLINWSRKSRLRGPGA